MRALADVADRYGNGEIRLTVWQNLVIPHIPSEHLEVVTAGILAAGLSFDAGTVLSGTVACTGNQGCRFSASDTKTHAVELANMLDSALQILEPVNLHVTGCPHSCAQHYIGDIGLLGVKVGGEEGYQVSLGGGLDQDQGLARELFPAIRFANCRPGCTTCSAPTPSARRRGESFLAFTRRHAIDELKHSANQRSAASMPACFLCSVHSGECAVYRGAAGVAERISRRHIFSRRTALPEPRRHSRLRCCMPRSQAPRKAWRARSPRNLRPRAM